MGVGGLWALRDANGGIGCRSYRGCSSSCSKLCRSSPFVLFRNDSYPLHDSEEAQYHIGDVADRGEEDKGDQHGLPFTDVVLVSRCRYAPGQFKLWYTRPPGR